MNKPKGLTLVNRKPAIQIIIFPLAKRIGKIRRVADVMSRQSTKKAKDAYSNNIDDVLQAQLFRAGIKPSKIKSELDSFWDAVKIEIDKSH